MKPTTQLPMPDAAMQQHSVALTEHIIQRIQQAGGQIPFSEFMQHALYAPALGYYSGGLHKFGEQGDFITAPELSPLFSCCVAHQCYQVLSALPAEQRVILEFGAGSGRMATDILIALEQADCLPAQYWILELSSELQHRQRERLQAEAPNLVSRVQWLSQLPDAPFSGVVLGNEVLDAMPVERFHVAENAALERFYVTWQDEQFAWQVSNEEMAELNTLLEPFLDTLPSGYMSEYNPFLADWMQNIARCLQHGLILLFDYGFPRAEFYHPQRDEGTLMCHYRHHAHSDPLCLVGLQDITAHVDFTAVAETAHDAGLNIAGYTTQASFLLSCGISDLMQQIDPNDTVNWLRQTQQAKKLLLPSEMGELFKVIALTQGLEDVPLLGFSHDERARL